MATPSTYTVKLPKILDMVEYDGNFNLPNVRITISDKDTGNIFYDNIPTGNQITFTTSITTDLRLNVSKDNYKAEGRIVYLGNPVNNVYRLIKHSNDKEVVIISIKREDGYCCSGEKLVDYVHGFNTRNFDNFALTDSKKILTSTSTVLRNLTSKLNTCLTTPIATPNSINDFKAGFVSELSDEDELNTIYVKGPLNEDETELNYGWQSKHAYVFKNSFKLFVAEKNNEYLTFEAYDESVNSFSVKLMKYGNPNEASIQYRYFDKDSGKSINYTGGTTYEVTSTEMSQIRNSFSTGKTCTISNARVNFTLYDRISCNGVTYEVEETEDGGYRLVESSSDYAWTDYTYGTVLTSEDNGTIIQFRRNPNDSSHYFSKNTSNFYYFDVLSGFVNIYGSINTLLVYNDNITLDTTDENDKYIFYKLFNHSHSINIKKVKDLKLKSTVLTEGCYSNMFCACNFSEVPLQINAESLMPHSCEKMFAENNSLTFLPSDFFIFNISNLCDYCYAEMFSQCGSLTLNNTQTININSCGEYCCYKMFYNCNKNKYCNIKIGNQTNVNISNSAFYQMFSENSKLELGIIKILAGNVGERGLAEMFYNCEKMLFPSETADYYVHINGSIGESGCYGMFYNCKNIRNTSSVNLSIYTNSIGISGCSNMFYQCTELKVPVLFTNHTIDLVTNDYCFSNMFYNCEKLIMVPSIRVNVLARHSCEYMFYNCKKITIASNIFSTTGLTVGEYACQYMFTNCEKLIFGFNLRNATLSEGCFSHMFENCKALKSNNYFDFQTSTLPNYSCEYMFAGTEKLDFIGTLSNVSTVGDYACQYMFKDSKIEVPPSHGASTLGRYCYYHMFDSCYLKSDMKLIASVLPECCYSYMFYNATINNFRKTLYNKSFNSCGVRSFSHMFDSAKSRDISGAIISGFIIIRKMNSDNPFYMKLFGSSSGAKNNANDYNYYKYPLYYWVLPYRSAYQDNNHIAMIQTQMRPSHGQGAYIIQYQQASGLIWYFDTYDLRYSNGTKFNMHDFLESSDTTATVYDYFDHEYASLGTYDKNEYQIKKVDIAPIEIDFKSNKIGSYCCDYMFYKCDFVREANMIKFKNAKLGTYSFAHMFDSCDNLISIPDLSYINEIETYCYSHMFANCKKLNTTALFSGTTSDSNFWYSNKILKLTSAPTGYNSTMLMYPYYIFGDSITTLKVGCCEGMFKNCTSLVYGPFIQNKTPNTNCYKEMFYNCKLLSRIYYDSSTKPQSYHSTNWVYNVSSSGTFYKGANANWSDNTQSTNSIPQNWTVSNINL